MQLTTCIHCGSGRVHRSRPRNWLDHALRPIGGRICRCHDCDTRFARFGGSLVRIADVRRAGQRLAIALIMMTAAAAILAGVVWLSHRPATSGPSGSQVHEGHCAAEARKN